MRRVKFGWKSYLMIITALAIAVRSIPSWIYSAWGTDFGIYYSITIEFLIKKNPFYEYPAVWGSSGYGSFPMLYLIILGAHFLTGLPPQQLLLKIPPIIGGLTVIPLYMITYEITKDRKISLIASALLAINPIHVYQTSMPYLLTVGHFFLLLSLYFFIKWIKERKYLGFLIVSSIALLLSHHLSNYMYIISITGISFIGGLYNYIPKKTVKRAFRFTISFTTVSIVYWILRVPGMKYFMSSPFHYALPWYGTATIGIILLIILYKIAITYNLNSSDKLWKKINSLKIINVFALSLGLSITVFLILALVGLHGYYIPPIAIFYSIPFMLTIGFIGVGFVKLKEHTESFYFVGSWLLSIIASLIVGLITWSSLEPWRHIEYMMEPLSIIGAIGIASILNSEFFHKISVRKRVSVSFEGFSYTPHKIFGENTLEISNPIPLGGAKVVGDPITYEEKYPVGKVFKTIFIFTITFIVLMSGISAFPFMNHVERSTQEGISPVIMSGIEWLNENGNRNYTVATNHMIGTILEAYGFPSSFEYDYEIWNATNWTDCIDELQGLNGTYPPIGYVLITKDMYENGVFGYNNSQNPLEPPVFMGKEGYEKFHREPFKLIYRNATADNSNWVEVYTVDWHYINNYLQSHNQTKTSQILLDL